MGSGLYRRSWTSLPTPFISARQLSERTVYLHAWRLRKVCPDHQYHLPLLQLIMVVHPDTSEFRKNAYMDQQISS